jgi:acetaldehyde dehydrogenase (acetylating)
MGTTAKESGVGWSVASVDDSGGTVRAIINDVTNLQFSTPRGVQDVTGIDKSAMERLLLLADFSITLNGVFNDATNLSHDVFKTVPSTSVARTVTLTVSGQTLANEVLFTDYPLSRSASGELTWAVPGVLTGGVTPTWS